MTEIKMSLTEIIQQLESCNYECEAGLLVNNAAFFELKKLAESQPVLPEERHQVLAELPEIRERAKSKVLQLLDSLADTEELSFPLEWMQEEQANVVMEWVMELLKHSVDVVIEEYEDALQESSIRGDYFDKLYNHQQELREQLLRKSVQLQEENAMLQSQIDKLANYFMNEYPEAITEGGAVDIAIETVKKLLEHSRKINQHYKIRAERVKRQKALMLTTLEKKATNCPDCHGKTLELMRESSTFIALCDGCKNIVNILAKVKQKAESSSFEIEQTHIIINGPLFDTVGQYRKNGWTVLSIVPAKEYHPYAVETDNLIFFARPINKEKYEEDLNSHAGGDSNVGTNEAD
ncbi:MAG: hypothetical protein JWN30_849 [Bacilli bacterium]|nr:hypothetical protein [Bacilli bacterium]